MVKTEVTVEGARAFADGVRAEGRRLALVPTMGFLHEGHLSLIEEGARRSDVVAVSIFVNPTQFGPKEDLATYPRDLAGDLEKCARAGASFVFTPTPAQMYPEGYQTYVEVTQVSLGLCGEKRPGHFRGVATVVTQLFGIFHPHVALFGEKDFQQLKVIDHLARDLKLGVEVVGMPTIREADGLAKSSRNSYLSRDERARAIALFAGLSSARTLRQGGERRRAPLVEAVRKALHDAQIREDYVDLVDADSLRPIEQVDPERPARLLVAGFLGKTRLIDNIGL